MNSPALDQLIDEMYARQRLIDDARRQWREGNANAAFESMLRFAEHVQSNEKRLLQLTVDCHSMIQLCQKAIEGEVLRRPMIVKLEEDRLTPDPIPTEGK